MKHTGRHGVIQHDEPAVDHGTSGLAQRARPSELFEQKETRFAQEKLQVTTFEVGTGVLTNRMLDTHPIDIWTRSAQLTERQINAAWDLTRSYRLGFPARSITPAYGAVRGGDGSEQSDHQRSFERRSYTRMMKFVPEDCRHVLARMVRGEYPGVSCGLQLVRKGLDAVADKMQLPRETFTNGKGWSA